MTPPPEHLPFSDWPRSCPDPELRPVSPLKKPRQVREFGAMSRRGTEGEGAAPARFRNADSDACLSCRVVSWRGVAWRDLFNGPLVAFVVNLPLQIPSLPFVQRSFPVPVEAIALNIVERHPLRQDTFGSRNAP